MALNLGSYRRPIYRCICGICAGECNALNGPKGKQNLKLLLSGSLNSIHYFTGEIVDACQSKPL